MACIAVNTTFPPSELAIRNQVCDMQTALASEPLALTLWRRSTCAGAADKLAETKRAEREARLAAQREQQAAKEKREAQRLAEAATARDLRAFHGHSKRHQKEVKEVRTEAPP